MRRLALAAVGCVALAGLAYGQVKWNEMPLPDGVFREYRSDYRTDVVDIALEAGGELEYKLGINQGDSIVYQWDAVDLKEAKLLYAEFHGHTEPVNGAGDLMFYRKATGASERGVLNAPFTGVHGWYLRNDGEQRIVVRLRVAGFYQLLPQ
jgi:hypothetical protein